jgi:hypothetical protein
MITYFGIHSNSYSFISSRSVKFAFLEIEVVTTVRGAYENHLWCRYFLKQSFTVPAF